PAERATVRRRLDRVRGGPAPAPAVAEHAPGDDPRAARRRQEREERQAGGEESRKAHRFGRRSVRRGVRAFYPAVPEAGGEARRPDPTTARPGRARSRPKPQPKAAASSLRADRAALDRFLPGASPL